MKPLFLIALGMAVGLLSGCACKTDPPIIINLPPVIQVEQRKICVDKYTGLECFTRMDLACICQREM